MDAVHADITTRLLEQIRCQLADIFDKITDRPYNMIAQIYSENTYVPVSDKCFAFMFTNVGFTPASVNGMVVFPSATPLTALGDSRTISGHDGDIYKGNITLAFIPPIIPIPQLELVQLYYI